MEQRGLGNSGLMVSAVGLGMGSTTTAQAALAWLFVQGADIIPILGTKQQKYLEQNVAALALQLTPAELVLPGEMFRPGARAGDRYNPGYFEMLGV